MVAPVSPRRRERERPGVAGGSDHCAIAAAPWLRAVVAAWSIQRAGNDSRATTGLVAVRSPTPWLNAGMPLSLR